VSLELGLWRRGPLTDLGALVVAVGALAGAFWARALPVWVGLVAVVVALGVRRTLALAVAVGVLTAGLAHQAWAGLTPLPGRPFQGVVVLTSDPQPSFGGWRADARTGVGRLEVSARGGAGGRLGSRQAGERVEVHGRIEGMPDQARTASRHVRGRLVADRVVPVDDGTPLVQLVNGVRSLVVDGARSLPRDQRALFTGFVLGDDRGASVVVADDFQGAGLSHLLVVSGQNVAFVLVVAMPLLARLRHRSRFVAVIAVLVLFAAVTRFEPSVLRATAMAAVAALGVVLGRPVSGVRVLALAVTGLVLVDPLLVHSLGFRLSTAASAGIILGAGRLASALPGPRWLRLAMAVTLAAQAAVAPLLVPAFGPMPVAALPANLLAEPVAGLVMMWGCTAGVVAGLLPPPLATLIHWPTRLGLWWVAGVARVGADAPFGRVGLAVIAIVAAALGLGVVVHRTGRPRAAVWCAAASILVLVVAPHLGGVGPGSGRVDLGGAELWRGSGPGTAAVLVVPGDARADVVLSELRRTGPRTLDLVVLRSPGPQAAELLRVLRERIDVGVVWAPRGSPAPGAVQPPAGPVRAGGLSVTARAAGERLDVEVEVHPAGEPG
jgi:competence protein ComEC